MWIYLRGDQDSPTVVDTGVETKAPREEQSDGTLFVLESDDGELLSYICPLLRSSNYYVLGERFAPCLPRLRGAAIYSTSPCPLKPE